LSDKAELTLNDTIAEGAKGMAARRVQEWLGLHGYGTGIAADYGSATATAVRKFQSAKSLAATGKVHRKTWEALTADAGRLDAYRARYRRRCGVFRHDRRQFQQ